MSNDNKWRDDNKFRLVGKISRVKHKYITKTSGDNKSSVSNLSFAINPPVYKTTHMFFCEAWNEVATDNADLPDGTIVRVEGHVKKSAWKQDGETKYAIVFVASSIDVVEAAEAPPGPQSEPEEESKPESVEKEESKEEPKEDPEEEEVPF